MNGAIRLIYIHQKQTNNGTQWSGLYESGRGCVARCQLTGSHNCGHGHWTGWQIIQTVPMEILNQIFLWSFLFLDVKGNLPPLHTGRVYILCEVVEQENFQTVIEPTHLENCYPAIFLPLFDFGFLGRQFVFFSLSRLGQMCFVWSQ